jgi:hypothetical protein
VVQAYRQAQGNCLSSRGYQVQYSGAPFSDHFMRVGVHQHLGSRVGGVNRIGGLIADAVGH